MNYVVLEQLPHPPQDLLDAALNSIDESAIVEQASKIQRNSGEILKKYPRFPLSDELKLWCMQNIIDNAIAYELAVSEQSEHERIKPHTDRNRNYTLMYLLRSGGENHRTVFYKHVDDSFILTRKQSFDNNVLIEIESIAIPQHKWVLLDAQVIHSVECIPDMRVAIQISLEINHWLITN